jgi:Tol biopolymer transport system component
MADVDGTNQVLHIDGVAQPISLPPGRNYAWSPDGRRIAYISEGCVTNDWDIYVFELENGAAKKATATQAVVKEGVSWLADNISVVFSTGSQLITIDIESGQETIVAYAATDSAGYLHYHEGLRGRASSSASNANGRYLIIEASLSGHGICA